MLDTRKEDPLCLQCGLRPMHARQKCRNCYDKWLKNENPEYREAQLENCESWSKANRKKLAEYNQGRARDATAKRYGISREELEDLFEDGCALCGRMIGLCVDHCHATNEIRGCLCVTCNVGVGWLEKKEWFIKAQVYLRHKEKVCDHNTFIVEHGKKLSEDGVCKDCGVLYKILFAKPEIVNVETERKK